MKYLLILVFVILSAGCVVNKQVEWTPEMFRLKCVNGQLWAYNDLGKEIELDDYEQECDRAAKLQNPK